MSKGIIEVRGLTKIFLRKGGMIKALENVNFHVKEGEILTILGPSGCGKTTLLRIVAGLDKPTEGEILFEGKPIEGPSKDRGMIFQEFALFPWRKVIANVEFGLEIQGYPKNERRKLAKKYIDLVGLAGFENAWVHELSGGMKQRVALARVLINNPKVLLMDEPFGSVDIQTRILLQDELLRLHKQTNKTVIFVTHSIEEATYLGDRIIILTARPGTIKELINVYDWLPFKRDRLSEEFLELKKYVSNILSTEVSKEATRGASRI